jgi:hypothetical protein
LAGLSANLFLFMPFSRFFRPQGAGIPGEQADNMPNKNKF